MARPLRDVYGGLATLLQSGVPPEEALCNLRTRGGLEESLGASLESAAGRGETVSAALARHPEEFPAADVALIEAGELSGHLVESLQRLVRLHDERRAARRQLFSESAYPIFIAHLAVMLLPMAQLAVRSEFSVGAWLSRVLGILAPIYLLVWIARRLARDARWRQRFQTWIDHLPGFGAAARHHRRAQLATVLVALYEAGVPLDRAVSLAGQAAGAARAEEVARSVREGHPLVDSLAPAELFAPSDVTRLATGELAGELSSTLHSIAAEESEQAESIFRRSMSVLGRGLYLLIVAWIALSVIGFYFGLYEGLLG